MQILLLEDVGRFSSTINFALKQYNHVIDVCARITQANAFLKNNKYDCMIVDLFLDTTGLDDNQRKESDSGYFTGWIWLRDKVFNDNLFDRRKVIIYSAYLVEFKAKKPNENTDGIIMLPKNNKNHQDDPIKNIDKIINALNKVQQYSKVST